MTASVKLQCADATSFMHKGPLGKERDACVGNGALGCLATCYLGSGASQELPVQGYGLRYRYGALRPLHPARTGTLTRARTF